MCSLSEDIDHLYFVHLGILLTIIAGWKGAIFAALATFLIRAAIRYFGDKKEEKK